MRTRGKDISWGQAFYCGILKGFLFVYILQGLFAVIEFPFSCDQRSCYIYFL